MTTIPKEKRFLLKDVTINIDRRTDTKGDYFDMYASQLNSPLNYPYSTAEEAAKMLEKWIENTLNAMGINNAETITLNISWK